MSQGWWRLLQWLPVACWVMVVVRYPGITESGDPLLAPPVLEPLTGFWLLLLALSFARLQLPLGLTIAVGSALLAAGALLVLLPAAVPALAATAGVGTLLLDYRYGGRYIAMEAAAYGLRALLPYGLLRTLLNGPWPQGVGLFVALAGGALALGAAIRALRSPDPRRAQSLALYGAALSGVGLASPLAVIAVCWTLLVLASLGVGAAPLLHMPLPFMAPFVAWWLLVAAAAGSQSWLLVGALVLAVLCCGMAAVRTAVRPRRLSARNLIVQSVMLVAGVLCGVEIKSLRPVADRLAIGLTQLGIVDAWPWIGVGALNAAHQRVMVLPSVVWVAIGLVSLAVVLLLTPFRRQSAVYPEEESNDFWQMLEERIWWLGRG